jgi:RNA polymerase sigma-70 factor, ECF subfamily
MTIDNGEVTLLLKAMKGGDPAAGLLRTASPGQALYAPRSAGSHVAGYRIYQRSLHAFGRRRFRLQNREHFIGVAAQVMRRVLVDHARAHRAK